uniref:ZP domain-containing protein n=1 Tax=Strongyloides venezuelensis TaxID=75913 RepID=A0A0K0FRC1_STRVS
MKVPITLTFFLIDVISKTSGYTAEPPAFRVHVHVKPKCLVPNEQVDVTVKTPEYPPHKIDVTCGIYSNLGPYTLRKCNIQNSGSTENWMSLENAKNLGVNLKSTNETSTCMADESVLKTIAMFDCKVDFKNGKGIQVLFFLCASQSDLFEIRSDSGTSIESSLTIDNSENEVLLECKDEDHESSLLRDHRRKMKNIFSGELQAYLDKEKRSNKHAVDDKIPSDFMRVCVDYSKLNQFLTKKKVDLIRLENVIDMVSDLYYLSTKEVSAAYKVLPLDGHFKELTCFYALYSIYKAKTLPFGLATAPTIFFERKIVILLEIDSGVCHNHICNGGFKFKWKIVEQKHFDTILSILRRNSKITTIPESAQVVVVVTNQHRNSISSALY